MEMNLAEKIVGPELILVLLPEFGTMKSDFDENKRKLFLPGFRTFLNPPEPAKMVGKPTFERPIFLARFLTRFLARFLIRFLARVLTRVWQGQKPLIQCTVLPGQRKTS